LKKKWVVNIKKPKKVQRVDEHPTKLDTKRVPFHREYPYIYDSPYSKSWTSPGIKTDVSGYDVGLYKPASWSMKITKWSI